MAQGAATDVGKIAELGRKAQLFDEDFPIADVDEAKAQHIPLISDLAAIVAGMVELKSILDTICKKAEVPYLATLAVNVAELKATHGELAKKVDIRTSKQDETIEKLDMFLKRQMTPK